MRRTFFSPIAVCALCLVVLNHAVRADSEPRVGGRPDILFIITDQQRFDTIAALGNSQIYTPNLDRLVARGVTFNNAYSACPECIPARYSLRTGYQPPRTAVFANTSHLTSPKAAAVQEHCGPYLATVMGELGYRTFGIGKFHAYPVWNEDLGYDVHLYGEEFYEIPEQRAGDHYAVWLKQNHPEFAFLEAIMGERSAMYYSPQMSPLPAELNVGSWVADNAVKQIQMESEKPYFGFVSFIDPHPPLAPPQPFNRLYNPDNMPDSITGKLHEDYLDDHIPWMNYMVWAENIDEQRAKILRARYYGEITFVDQCIGRILDAVEAGDNPDNTLICFVSDHGDLLGDHHGWQKECFFEASCRIPFLLSWPARFKQGGQRDDLVGLFDLFGIATTAAGAQDLRDGTDVLGALEGNVRPRKHFFGYYGAPGTRFFKMMVRAGDWKYIFLANGGYEQLFNLADDPNELNNVATLHHRITRQLRQVAVDECQKDQLTSVLAGDDFLTFPFGEFEKFKLPQFDKSRGIMDFPESAEDGLRAYNAGLRPVASE